jgi:sugar/nucleoside kinase (ribokinase family)
MAKFLKRVQEKGIKTSVDTVSCEDKSVYSKNILPVLKYTDYLIVNEIECCCIFGKDAYLEDGTLDKDMIKECMQLAINAGVKEKVIVHAKAGGFCMDKNGKFTAVGSLIIDPSLIKGNVGAGDAFCAGCLYSLYTGSSDEDMLSYACASAACNLFSPGSVSGAVSKSEIIKMNEKFSRREI